MSEEITKFNRFKRFVNLTWKRIYWFPVQVALFILLFSVDKVLRLVLHVYDFGKSRGRKGWLAESRRSMDPLYDYRRAR